LLDKIVWEKEENIAKCLKKTKRIVTDKKMFIGGWLRVESLGLCPLNCDSAVVSRLSCSAPCHKGHFCLKDPSLDKILPFLVDGFCKMHMFEDMVVQDFEQIPKYQEMGVNEFVIDFSAIHSPLIPKVLKNYLTILKHNSGKQ